MAVPDAGREGGGIKLRGQLSRGVARIVYHHLFSTPEGGRLLHCVWRIDVTPFEWALAGPLYSACRWAMLLGMDLPEGLPKFVAAVDGAFEEASRLLADGRRFLCGTKEMTAADVTFASLADVLVLPEQKARGCSCRGTTTCPWDSARRYGGGGGAPKGGSCCACTRRKETCEFCCCLF